jgi:hypothetical protein
MHPYPNFPGDIGPPNETFYVEVWIMPDTTMPDDWETTMSVTAYDKAGLPSDTLMYDLWYEEETDPPQIMTMEATSRYVRKGRPGDTWEGTFRIEAEKGVEHITMRLAGHDTVFDSISELASLGIDPDYEYDQVGVYTINSPGLLSWMNYTGSWQTWTMWLFDNSERYDAASEHNALFVKDHPFGVWEFSSPGYTQTFMCTIRDNGYLIRPDGCCCSSIRWEWHSLNIIRVMAYHDGCCGHFPESPVLCHISDDGNHISGSTSLGDFSAVRHDRASSASAATMAIVAEEQGIVNTVVDEGVIHVEHE